MPNVRLKNGVKIHFQDEGGTDNPVVILIMGLGAQMTVWPDSFYFGLVNKGFRVIRFDNRDIGLSSHLDHLGSPNLFTVWLRKQIRVGKPSTYTLDDMAQDVIELMAKLNIKRAHIVGASMGGMIGQIIAAKYKKRTLSLTSIMSSVSNLPLSTRNMKLIYELSKHHPKSASYDEFVNYTVKLNQLVASPYYPQSEQVLYSQAQEFVSRAINPNGVKRQFAAIAASSNRKNLLNKIKVPTLVIHGENDPVIPVMEGMRTAHSIKRAKLKTVQGLGHNFPPELMKSFTKWIFKHIVKAEKRFAKKQLAKINKKRNSQLKDMSNNNLDK